MKWQKFKPRQYGLALCLGMTAVLVIGYLGYRWQLRPVSSTEVPQSFVVAPGENAQTVGRHLESAKLIHSSDAFVTYINFHGLRANIKAGSYSLSPHQSAGTIAEILANGKVNNKRLVIPEGSTLIKIGKLAAGRGINEADFRAALAAPHSQAFLASKPAGASLEGYLFPASYEVNSATSGASLVETMLGTFEQQVTDKYAAAFATQGLTLHQGLTMASLVEREVNRPDSRPLVAQVFLKRYRMGMSLGSDASVSYASELAGKTFDLEIDSPYNTRKYAGLPPGPVCSPGLPSIEAAAFPANTDYLYFLTGKDGRDYFTKTYAEHQRNIDRYLN